MTLKSYIDEYLLTPEVISKYEEHLKQRLDGQESTEDVLSFLMHEIKGAKLRRGEREFFGDVSLYSDILDSRLTKFLSMPQSNPRVRLLV